MRGPRPSHRRSSLPRLRPDYALESSVARARISDISGDKIFFFLILSNNHAAIPKGAARAARDFEKGEREVLGISRSEERHIFPALKRNFYWQ